MGSRVLSKTIASHSPIMSGVCEEVVTRVCKAAKEAELRRFQHQQFSGVCSWAWSHATLSLYTALLQSDPSGKFCCWKQEYVVPAYITWFNPPRDGTPSSPRARAVDPTILYSTVAKRSSSVSHNSPRRRRQKPRSSPRSPRSRGSGQSGSDSGGGGDATGGRGCGRPYNCLPAVTISSCGISLIKGVLTLRGVYQRLLRETSAPFQVASTVANRPFSTLHPTRILGVDTYYRAFPIALLVQDPILRIASVTLEADFTLPYTREVELGLRLYIEILSFILECKILNLLDVLAFCKTYFLPSSYTHPTTTAATTIFHMECVPRCIVYTIEQMIARAADATTTHQEESLHQQCEEYHQTLLNEYGIQYAVSAFALGALDVISATIIDLLLWKGFPKET